MRFGPDCKTLGAIFRAGNARELLKTVADGQKVCYTIWKNCGFGPFAGHWRSWPGAGPAVWKEPERKGESTMLHTNHRLRCTAFPVFISGRNHCSQISEALPLS